MGIPVGHSDLVLPEPLLHLFSLLISVLKLVSRVLNFVGLSYLFGSLDISTPRHHHRSLAHRSDKPPSAMLIQEFLPAVPYTPSPGGSEQRGISCAICLWEFCEGQEVRWLRNCLHVFHGRCIDPWVELGRRSCPLCRAPLVPHELRDVFRRRLMSSAAAPPEELLSAYDDGDGGLYLLGDPFRFLLHSNELLR